MPEEGTSLPNLKKTRILGGVVLLILVVGAGAWYWVSRSTDDQKSKTTTNSSKVNQVPTFDARGGQAVADADGDGLADAEESTLGTNPTVADTDKDGLSDFDEAKVYRSDPKNSDTDKDGNPDGTEVSKGFSPTGAGKLFDTSSSVITNATP